MEIVFPTMEDIEQVCYPQACTVFTDPDYLMPPLKWHDKNRMEAALGAVANGPLRSVPAVAAHLAYYVTKNHPFVDGNKRMTVIILLSFLAINHWNPRKTLTKDEVVTFIEGVSGSKRDAKEETIDGIEDWIRARFSTRAHRPWWALFTQIPTELTRLWPAKWKRE